MTQGEFAQGWKLLILQPWGWRYRALTPEGQPTEESRLQMNFYYDKLKWAHPEAWLKVAQQHAAGDEWPPILSLTLALRAINVNYQKTLPAPSWKDLTLDEFGQDLYECIKKFSERQWLREKLQQMTKANLETINTLQFSKTTKQQLQQLEAKLSKEIIDLMPSIQPADAKRLLEKYETKGAA